MAVLLRMKAARDAAMAARQARDGRRFPPVDHDRLRAAARSRWPASLALLRALAADYQKRSEDLGIRVEVEELVRLRAWLPELVIHVTRADGELGTRLVFRMTGEGRTFCRVQQTRGARRPDLDRDDRPIEMAERTLRSLLRTVVQILMVH